MERVLHRALAFAASVAPLFLALLSLQNIPIVSSITPYVVTGAGYVTVNGTLYIQGGGRLYAQGGLYTDTNATSAFVSLSLSSPWNDTAPPWKEITVPAQFDSRNLFQGLAVTPDRTRLVFWGTFQTQLTNDTFTLPPQNDSMTIFSLVDSTWSKLTFVSNPLAYGYVSVLIDPATSGKGLGMIYAPNGCYDNPLYPDMCQMDLDKKKIAIRRMPGGLVPVGVKYFSFAYCTSRKTMMLYGGVSEKNEPNVSLYEYATSTLTWSLLQPQGAPPGDIQRHCMVETTDRSKMIVFGGMNIGEQVSSRLFILHVNNLTWTEGPDIGGANARMGHVCATNGDSFIVWGGLTIQNGKAVVVTDLPLIYNIPKNAWVRNFVVSNQPALLPSTTSTSTGPAPSSDNVSPPPSQKKSSSLGAAVGGAIGGIAAIAAIGFFFYRSRKRTENGGHHPTQLKRSSEDNTSRLGRNAGFLGRNNSGKDTDDKDTYGDYPGTYTDQPQSSSARHTIDPYPPASPQFVQQYQSAPSPQNSHLTYGYSNELESPRFSGVSSYPPPPPPFQPAMSMTTITSPQGTVSPFPGDQHGQSIYYDGGKDVLPSPYSAYPQYSPIGSDGQGVRTELRSPQQLGPGQETSPAAWMAARNVRNSYGNPHSMIGQGLEEKSEFGGRSSYYPPPPGQQQSPPTESDLMQKKLMLMKAQHELDVEKMRLEQESQRQLIERQFVHGSG